MDIISISQKAYDVQANNLHALLPNIHCSKSEEQIDNEPSVKFANRSESINENKQ